MDRVESRGMSIPDHFFYLGADDKALMGTTLSTRNIGLELSHGDVLVALDEARNRHLLVPVDSTVDTEDDSVRGVGLSSRTLAVEGDAVHYVDAYCKLPALGRVFERFVEDVVDRLRTETVPPEVTVVTTLEDWTALLEAEPDPLTPAQRIGLVGELLVMRELARSSPLGALDSWRGPDGANHDFVREGVSIEVKSTASHEGRRVRISSLDQLDPGLAESLYLVVAHLWEDVTGESIDDILSDLVSLGVPPRGLMSKVARVGYVHEQPQENPKRYGVRSLQMWRVDDSFPGLRRSDFSEDRIKGVTGLRYNLDLDVAPPPVTDEESQLMYHIFASNGAPRPEHGPRTAPEVAK